MRGGLKYRRPSGEECSGTLPMLSVAGKEGFGAESNSITLYGY